MVGLHTFYSEGMSGKRDMGYEKTHHAQSMSEKKCLRHEKKRRISHVRKKEEKGEKCDHAKRSSNKFDVNI
jgi:hypothetical protein